jgi:putative two-component system response regulator
LHASLGYLRQQKGQHFDAALVDLFIEQMPAIRKIQERWAEK